MIVSKDFVIVHTVSERKTIQGDKVTVKTSENWMLKKYVGNDENIVIPVGINTIGPRAFENCKSLTSVLIPGSVKMIGANAFSKCNNLETVCILKGNKRIEIGYRAFGECENLKELVIEGDMLWANGHPCMFSHCPNLTIYGPTNSSIQVHAKQEKISFVEI